MPLPEMGYTLVTSGPSGDQGPTEPGFINGGMMQRQEPFTAPNIVIDVDNLEDALKAVNDAGGSTVSERQAVGDMGFAAYFKDPEGNLVGLWENRTSGRADRGGSLRSHPARPTFAPPGSQARTTHHRRLPRRRDAPAPYVMELP